VTRAAADVTFRVFIAEGRHGSDGDLPALLDMLRYEGGVVEDWSRARDSRDRSGYSVRIRVPAVRFTPDRWRSFGISPEVL
jgi:hypothetical protein